MSLNAFARQAGLSPQRLSWWRKRLGEWAPARDGASELRLVPVVTSVATEEMRARPSMTMMRLPAGRRRRGVRHQGGVTAVGRGGGAGSDEGRVGIAAVEGGARVRGGGAVQPEEVLRGADE